MYVFGRQQSVAQGGLQDAEMPKSCRGFDDVCIVVVSN